MSADLLVEFGWKSTAVCAVALFASLALRGRPAAQRVAMLRAGVAALLLLPLLILTVPVLEIAVLPAAEPLPTMASAPVATFPAATPDAVLEFDWIALAYGAGGALVLLRLILGLILLYRWSRLAVPASHPVWVEAIARAAEPLRRPVRLLVSPRVASPLSLGVAPATILIGPEIERSPDRAAAVIAHEIAHVRRFDWPAMLAARIALALFWFNPLAWLLVAELARQTELAADEEAVTHVTRADYAQTLLAVAGGCEAHGACGMAVRPTAMARRIRRVLDTGPRKPASGLLCAALIGSIPLGIAPLAAMQLVPAPAAPAQPVRPKGDLRAAIVRYAETQDAQRSVKPLRQVVRIAPARVAKRRVGPPAPPARSTPIAAGLEPPLAMMQAQKPPVGDGFEARLVAKMERWRMTRRTPAGEEATGVEATRQAEATARRMASATVAASQGEKPLPVKTVWRAGPDQRSQVKQRIQAASQLRAAAQSYRVSADDPSLSPDIRQGYRSASDSLRGEAAKLEKQARQMRAAF